MIADILKDAQKTDVPKSCIRKNFTAAPELIKPEPY